MILFFECLIGITLFALIVEPYWLRLCMVYILPNYQEQRLNQKNTPDQEDISEVIENGIHKPSKYH